MVTHHKATERHLPYGITQCYRTPTSVRENVWGNSKKRKKSCFFLDFEKKT